MIYKWLTNPVCEDVGQLFKMGVRQSWRAGPVCKTGTYS